MYFSILAAEAASGVCQARAIVFGGVVERFERSQALLSRFLAEDFSFSLIGGVSAERNLPKSAV